MDKVGRNDPCPCGSGKKYKKCCMVKDSHRNNLPGIVTPDGDDVTFLEAYYDCTDQKEAIRCLALADDFDFGPDEPSTRDGSEARFVWLARGESGRLLKSGNPARLPDILGGTVSIRLLGNVALKFNRLILNATSQAILDVGKKRLELVLGNLIKHRLDSVQSLGSVNNAVGMDSQDLRGGDRPPRPGNADGDMRFGPLGNGESLQDAIRDLGLETPEEINQFIGHLTQDYNNSPQEDMAGLSPVQVRRLLNADWEDENGPLRLNKKLGPIDVADTPLLHNVKLLINQCRAEGGAKATSAGNLNRRTVSELIPRLKFTEQDSLHFFLEERSAINEQDVWALHEARVIAGLAGLLRKYKGRFSPTKRGVLLMANEMSPELYHRLFLTTFRKFNLGYSTYVGHPDIQATIAYSLYVLSGLSQGVWQNIEGAMAKFMLPAVRDHIVDSRDLAAAKSLVKTCVMNWIVLPLALFGLVEIKGKEIYLIEAFRVTPLFSRYIGFQI